jgi:hypothetical protein
VDVQKIPLKLKFSGYHGILPITARETAEKKAHRKSPRAAQKITQKPLKMSRPAGKLIRIAQNFPGKSDIFLVIPENHTERTRNFLDVHLKI